MCVRNRACLAVLIASLPAYLLNRAWVWNKGGAHSFTREVLPFWIMSLLGLWQYVGAYVHTRVAGAMDRGRAAFTALVPYLGDLAL